MKSEEKALTNERNSDISPARGKSGNTDKKKFSPGKKGP